MIWLVATAAVVLAALIGIPVLGSFLRERDFKRQTNNKAPERKADESFLPPSFGPDVADTDMEREQYMAWLKSKQNTFGPK